MFLLTIITSDKMKKYIPDSQVWPESKSWRDDE